MISIYPLQAQTSEWVIYHMDDTGIPYNSEIREVLVDDDDNIWAGTLNDGLIKFDGEV